MGTADLMLLNRPPIRLVLSALAMIAVGCVLAAVGSVYCADALTEDKMQGMLGLMGGAPFTSANDVEFVEKGAEILAQAGIAEGLSPRLMDGWDQLRQQCFLWIFLLFAVPAVLMAAVGVFSFLQEYRRLERLRGRCLQLRDGSPVEITDVYAESDCIGRVAEGVACIGRQMRHMTATLQQEKRDLAEFLTDLSHQLKTVLAVIRLNSDLLAEPNLLQAEQRIQLTEEITAQLDHMEVLLRTSLKLAKLEAGAVAYRMQQSSLRETCRAAVTELSPLLRQQKITVTVAHSDALLLHDGVWLREALQNIMKNAVDHAHCSEITVTVTDTPVYASVTLWDNGRGIPREEISRLFDRFGKKSNSSDMQSVGIGLAIAQKIVIAHGGEITVFSSPEEGTRFVLTFLR